MGGGRDGAAVGVLHTVLCVCVLHAVLCVCVLHAVVGRERNFTARRRHTHKYASVGPPPTHSARTRVYAVAANGADLLDLLLVQKELDPWPTFRDGGNAADEELAHVRPVIARSVEELGDELALLEHGLLGKLELAVLLRLTGLGERHKLGLWRRSGILDSL